MDRCWSWKLTAILFARVFRLQCSSGTMWPALIETESALGNDTDDNHERKHESLLCWWMEQLREPRTKQPTSTVGIVFGITTYRKLSRRRVLWGDSPSSLAASVLLLEPKCSFFVHWLRRRMLSFYVMYLKSWLYITAAAARRRKLFCHCMCLAFFLLALRPNCARACFSYKHFHNY